MVDGVIMTINMLVPFGDSLSTFNNQLIQPIYSYRLLRVRLGGRVDC